MFGAAAILTVRKIAAYHWHQSERGQQRCGYLQADELLGITGARQRKCVADRHREIAEHLLAFLHGPVARVREADAPKPLGLARRAQSNQAIRVPVRQRAQEDGIDDAERRDVRADPEREAQNRDERKAGRLEQLPDGVAKLSLITRSVEREDHYARPRAVQIAGSWCIVAVDWPESRVGLNSAVASGGASTQN